MSIDIAVFEKQLSHFKWLASLTEYIEPISASIGAFKRSERDWELAYARRDTDAKWRAVNGGHMQLKEALSQLERLVSNASDAVVSHIGETRPGAHAVEAVFKIVLPLERAEALVRYNSTWPRPFLNESFLRLAKLYKFTDTWWYQRLVTPMTRDELIKQTLY